MALEARLPAAERQPGRLERRKAQTRAAILHAAGRLFQQQGYDETSIQQIAELADTGVGTVYGYFASKEEILNEVLRAHSDEAVERYLASVDEHTPAIDRVCRALDALAQYLREHRVILLAAFQQAARTRAVAIDDQQAAWLFEAYRSLILRGIEAGELRPVPVDATVRVLLGTYTMAMLGVGVWHGREDDPQTLADLEQVVRSLLLRD